jgi:hypothetical protein
MFKSFFKSGAFKGLAVALLIVLAALIFTVNAQSQSTITPVQNLSDRLDTSNWFIQNEVKYTLLKDKKTGKEYLFIQGKHNDFIEKLN